jgi:histidine kinase-like protein
MSATTRHGGQDGGLRVTVSRDGDARVALAGVLGPVDVPAVRDGLAVLLRDVDRVLVDVTGLALAHPCVLQVFPDAVDQGGGWPAVRLAVVHGGRVMGQALRASRVARRVAVADEPELALLRCAEQPAEVRAQWWFPAAPDALARCRGAVGLRLASWSVPDAGAQQALVVVNELVTNAVQHAGTAVRVGLVLDGTGLAVRVRDFSPHPAASTSQRRLGLDLVDGLASRWGFEPHGDGKTAWAQLPAVGRQRR